MVRTLISCVKNENSIFSPGLAMLMITILFILISNSVNSRRDMAILFNRIASIILIYCIVQDYVSLFVLNKGIGLHGGLLYISSSTQIFQIFIFFISILILQLTSFLPRVKS